MGCRESTQGNYVMTISERKCCDLIIKTCPKILIFAPRYDKIYVAPSIACMRVEEIVFHISNEGGIAAGLNHSELLEML